MSWIFARMKKIIPLFLSLFLSFGLLAQEKQKKEKPSTPSPDFPGTLSIDYGLNYLTNNIHAMRTNPWRSATVNVYYFYPIKLGDSFVSANPGIGFGNEKLGFEDPYSFQDSAGFVSFKPIADLPRFANLESVKRTQLIAHYVDFNLEFRLHSRKEDFDRSWFIGLGGKVGVLIDGKTKIKYNESGRQKIYKDKDHFYMNSFRYGLVARIGYGPFNAWVYYSGSDLFRGNKLVNATNPRLWSFGISLATF